MHSVNVVKMLSARQQRGISLTRTHSRINYAAPSLVSACQVIDSEVGTVCFNKVWMLRPQNYEAPPGARMSRYLKKPLVKTTTLEGGFMSVAVPASHFILREHLKKNCVESGFC